MWEVLSPFVLGGTACCVAELVTFPIDTTKIRLQVQGQHTSAFMRQIKYRGMLHAFGRIAREEGVRVLYRGLNAALLRQACYGTLKLGIYENVQRIAHGPRVPDHYLTNLGAAVFAGGVSAAIASPTDRVKIRMQAHSPTQRYRSFADAVVRIARAEGVRGLYRGMGATAQRAALVAGVELPTYSQAKATLITHIGMSNGVLTHFCASMIAGLFSALASNPIDVVKSRLMNQSVVDGERMYRGVYDCFVQTIRNEGVRALYKGFVPTYLRQGPWNVTCFLTLEQLKRVFDAPRTHQPA